MGTTSMDTISETETEAAPAAADPRPAARRRWVSVALVLAVAAVAFVVRFALLSRGGGVLGIDAYDDGVYYAAADSLVHGRLPYRDFLFLHPPGIVLLLAPFAWLGSITSDPTGVLAARMAFVLLGGANAGLIAAVCLRYGRMAAAVGGGTYAVLFAAVLSERSSLLEPVGTAGTLAAILLLRHTWRRPGVALVLAGIPLGVAVATKIWYVVPAVVVIAFAGRWWWRMLVGAAAATAAICAPFFLAAPLQMFREIVSDQLGRPEAGNWPTVRRLGSLFGLLGVSAPTAAEAAAAAVPLILVLVAVLVVTVVTFTVRGARLFPTLLIAAMLVVLASPSYFPHYGALVAPPLAICTGIAVARLARPVPARPARAAIAAAVLCGVVAINAPRDLATLTQPIPAARLSAALTRVPGCVTSDDPSVLAAVNRLSRDLRRGCTVWPDVTGYTYDRDAARGTSVRRPKNIRWQRDVLGYLRSGDAVIIHRAATGLSAATRARVRQDGAIATVGTWRVWAVDHTGSTSR